MHFLAVAFDRRRVIDRAGELNPMLAVNSSKLFTTQASFLQLDPDALQQLRTRMNVSFESFESSVSFMGPTTPKLGQTSGSTIR